MEHDYSPGLHCLLTLSVEKSQLLTDMERFRVFIRTLLQKYELEEVGEVGYQFVAAGFTSSFCLKESHICIHTWPEFLQLTLDIYLCNYLRDNSQKVKDLTKDFIQHFEAQIIKQTNVMR